MKKNYNDLINFKFMKNCIGDYKGFYLWYYYAPKQLINMIKVSKKSSRFLGTFLFYV